MHFEKIENDYLPIYVFYTSKTKLIAGYITILEICDYTVCDVTNLKMAIIEKSLM